MLSMLVYDEMISRDVHEGMDDEKDILKKRQTVARSLSLFL